MRAPYAIGSNTDALGGIWQDVSLIAVAPVRVADAFVKPLVGQDRLEVEITIANDDAAERTVSVGGVVAPWLNRAGTSVADAPVPVGELGATALTLPAGRVTVPPGGTATLTLAATVGGRLSLWSPAAPHLNGLTLTVNNTENGGQAVDRHFTRFGWREVRISGQNVLLNGKKVQMFGDLVHPFGAWVMSRRYAWAWYRMVKDMGGNAVRLHAQPMPGYYLDMADEMGILVLDETALFGSSLQLNFNEPVAWDRFADHYDALVRRDRNHPSVFGWSFGNELFAIFDYNKVGQPQDDRWHAQLTALGLRAQRLDPTRQWIGCDGDEDLRGTLPVWSKHFGDGLRPNGVPRDLPKPRMVGESGGDLLRQAPAPGEVRRRPRLRLLCRARRSAGARPVPERRADGKWRTTSPFTRRARRSGSAWSRCPTATPTTRASRASMTASSSRTPTKKAYPATSPSDCRPTSRR